MFLHGPTRLTAPHVPEAWREYVKAQALADAVPADGYDVGLLASSVELVESFCGRLFAAADEAGGARAATATVEVEAEEINRQLPLLPHHTGEDRATLTRMLRWDRVEADWTDVTSDAVTYPWGAWSPTRPGTYRITAGVVVDVAETPAAVLEGIARVYGWRYARRSSRQDEVLMSDISISRSGAGELLAAHRTVASAS